MAAKKQNKQATPVTLESPRIPEASGFAMHSALDEVVPLTRVGGQVGLVHVIAKRATTCYPPSFPPFARQFGGKLAKLANALQSRGEPGIRRVRLGDPWIGNRSGGSDFTATKWAGRRGLRRCREGQSQPVVDH
jgi:hypothetical protein